MGCFVNRGGELELDTCFFQILLEDAADLFAHDGLHRHLVHADDGHVVILSQGIPDFHTDKGAADDHNLLILLLADGAQDSLDVCDETEEEDIPQFLEPGQGQRTRDAAGCENQLSIRDRLAGFHGDGFLAEIDGGYFVGDSLDSCVLVPLAGTPEEFLGVRD